MSLFRQVIGLLVFLVISFTAAAIGSLFTSPAVGHGGWYGSLIKPSWTPPNWLFGPVWTVLYALMAIASWLVWREMGSVGKARIPLALFTIQLVLNASWSIIFFGQHQVGWAFGVIILLWLAILVTLIAFWTVKRSAGWLMLPYLLWVTYASTLNYGIWQLLEKI